MKRTQRTQEAVITFRPGKPGRLLELPHRKRGNKTQQMKQSVWGRLKDSTLERHGRMRSLRDRPLRGDRENVFTAGGFFSRGNAAL